MENETTETFKDRLQNELSYSGLSNKEFAAAIGISINTLNMYLYRNSIPSADVAVKMAKALNTTVEHLVTGIPQKQNYALKTRKIKEIEIILNQLSDQHLSSLLDIIKTFCRAVTL